MSQLKEQNIKKESARQELELYFHIPFCVRKCLYCDFLSAPASKEIQDAYMEALFTEVKGRADEYRDYRVSSVFVGGGTPSVVEAKQIVGLMQLVKEHFSLKRDAEITIEVNPGTVDEDKLRAYRGAGINRLSIGLQSGDDRELAALGRIHTWQQFLETYGEARKAGFVNINVDVMSALPGQSLSSYRDTLDKVLHLEPVPEHISAYSLIVEEGTPFYDMDGRGELSLPDEECERRMYEETERILGEAGFERYEISNYARKGYACRHNCGYWRRADYIGLGIGAASLFQNTRFRNGNNMQAYLHRPLECREEIHVLSIKERMEEYMFLGLRMTRGVGSFRFRQEFGAELEEVYGGVIRKNKEDGLLYEYEDAALGEQFLALTKHGLDISNYVMAQFLFD